MIRRVLFLWLLIMPFGFTDDLSAVEDTCSQVSGRLVLPSDIGYDKSRLVSNYYSSKNSFPPAIVYCRKAKDVQNAVQWAICKKLPIRVRSGGHNHEGFSTGSDALIIDVSEMKALRIEKDQGLAIVEPGITGGELYSALFKSGLTQVGGTCEEVGVSGLVLTGGMGPLARIHGLACDNLVSFDMVKADGSLIQVTQDNEHKDLFWAACGGGGGNFGIVTSLTLKVYPARPVTWFNIGWDWSQPIEKIITIWQDFILKDDRQWFSHLDLWAKPFPAEKFNKMPIKALGVFYGTPDEAKKVLSPLLDAGIPSSQTIELVAWDKAIKLFEESTSTFITDKPEYKSSGSFAMKPLPKEAIDLIVTTLKDSPTPLLNVLFLCLGGAIKDRSSSDTAYFYRQAEFLVDYSSQWLEEKDSTPQLQEVDTLRDKMLAYTMGDYAGNPDRRIKDYLSAYWGDNVARLECVKRKYDPDNIFRFEQSVPPAAEACDSLQAKANKLISK